MYSYKYGVLHSANFLIPAITMTGQRQGENRYIFQVTTGDGPEPASELPKTLPPQQTPTNLTNTGSESGKLKASKRDASE